MAYLDKIVADINSAVKGKLLAFPAVEYLGISYPITSINGKAQVTVPGIIDVNGNSKEISFSDIPELILYHRIASSSYNQLKTNSYGDGNNTFQHTIEMELVVMGDRKRVNVQPDSLEVAIASNMPLSSPIQGFDYVNIYPVSANHNSRQLFSQEYQGLNYFLKPEYIFFSIRYRIELRYQKGCISLCHC